MRAWTAGAGDCHEPCWLPDKFGLREKPIIWGGQMSRSERLPNPTNDERFGTPSEVGARIDGRSVTLGARRTS